MIITRARDISREANAHPRRLWSAQLLALLGAASIVVGCHAFPGEPGDGGVTDALLADGTHVDADSGDADGLIDGDLEDGGGLDAELAAALDEALERGLAAARGRGALAAVEVLGQGRWLGAAGDDELSPSMPFRVGSITKMFIAVLVLQLVDEGTLDLEDTLGAWFPGVDNAESITIRQLLQHTSGVYDYTASSRFRDDFERDPHRVIGIEEVLGYVAENSPAFAPGSRWQYSNTGYYLLGAMLEAASGLSIAELLRDRISAPLGLESTFYEPQEDIPDDLAPGYSTLFGAGVEVSDAYDVSVAGPSGAIVSRAADLLSFLAALASGELVPPSLREQWLDPVDAGFGLGYGLGVMLFPFPGRTPFGHDGSIFGYITVISHFPADGISTVMFMNYDGGDLNSLALELLEALGLV